MSGINTTPDQSLIPYMHWILNQFQLHAKKRDSQVQYKAAELQNSTCSICSNTSSAKDPLKMILCSKGFLSLVKI